MAKTKRKNRVMALTTPLMHGADVMRLQSLLVLRGHLGQKQVDGWYGEITAQAVYRAKYWLGYRKPDHKAHDLLIAVLEGDVRLSPAMLLRRKRRLAAKSKPGQLTRGQRALKTALSQLGQSESPANSNRSKFSLWYGLIGPWCAMFVSWVYVVIKSKVFKRGSRYAYCPFILADARAGTNNLSLVRGAPKSGHLVLLKFSRGADPEHVAMYAEEEDLVRLAPVAFRAAQAQYGKFLKAGDFWTVEGNTGSTSQANGGRVEIKRRNKSQVVAIVNVGK